MDKPLTTKQQRFVDFYDGNATQAALKAGYSEKTARFIGAENLTKPNIAEAIRNREGKRNGKKIATREQRQQFWTHTMDDTDEEMRNRLEGSKLLGRSEADFIEKVEHSGQIKVEKIEIEMV